MLKDLSFSEVILLKSTSHFKIQIKKQSQTKFLLHQKSCTFLQQRNNIFYSLKQSILFKEPDRRVSAPARRTRTGSGRGHFRHICLSASLNIFQKLKFK